MNIEIARLAELEERIERGIKTFIDVGLALVEIRDSRLYRSQGYMRFEDYCRERWGDSPLRLTSRQRVHQVIAAAETSKIFDGNGPSIESHVRELARVKDPEVIRAVWREVEEEYPEPTARDVRTVVERHIQADPKPTPIRTDRQPSEGFTAFKMLAGTLLVSVDQVVRGMSEEELMEARRIMFSMRIWLQRFDELTKAAMRSEGG